MSDVDEHDAVEVIEVEPDPAPRPAGHLEATPPWFRLAAFVVFVAGTVAAVSLSIAIDRTTSEDLSGVIAIGAAVECGAIVLGAALAFFAYVLDLLIDIRDHTRAVAELSLLADGEVPLES